MTGVTAKISLVGDFAVGKTSTVSRFVDDSFSDNYLTTVGVKIDTKEVVIDEADNRIKLIIWDIAGKGRFSDTGMNYVRGSSGYLLVADGTRRESLDSALQLRDQIEETHGPLPYVLLLNKSDLEESWELSESAISGLRADGVSAHTTSAKTGDNVSTGIRELAETLFRRAVGT